MELNFKINENLLFQASLVKRNPTKGWVDVQNKLWDEFRSGYELLQGQPYSSFIDNTPLEKAVEDAEKLIKKGKKTPEFKKILKETNEYKNWLENEWQRLEKQITTEMEAILKAKLPDKEYTVFVFSPKSTEGRYLGNQRIVFGHPEDWKNYSIVYIIHEVLHDVFGDSDLEHAVIELATDNELRIRLNGSGQYFKAGEHEVGHAYLRKLEKKLLPEWKRYLETDKYEDIFDFVKKQS